MNGSIPDEIQGPENPNGAKTTTKVRTFRLDEINWGRILFLILLVVIAWVCWTIIQGLSGMGSSFGAIVMEWFRDASINPENKRAFANFLRLVLLAGFFWGILIIMTNNDKN